MTALMRRGRRAAEAAPEPQHRGRRVAARESVLTVIAERSILIALAMMFLAPLVFVLLTAFMTTDQAAGPEHLAVAPSTRRTSPTSSPRPGCSGPPSTR